ncbi:hypothetical protein AT6N2_C0521 [Agrobacterium tumefaciens]|nr:hypothetical protein AT6N2_C0521 [Agrobacterium tumefaciens]
MRGFGSIAGVAAGSTGLLKIPGHLFRRLILHQHFHVRIPAGGHLEIALVHLVLIAGNGGIFTFGQNHGRKGAHAFVDDVAAAVQHRPGGIGNGFAARFRDQLESNLGCLVLQRRFGQLACFHLNIGAHHRVDIAVFRNHVIGASIEPHDRVGLDIGHDEAAFAVRPRIRGIDGEFQLVAGDLLVGPCHGVQYESAGVENQNLFLHVAGSRHVELLGDAGAAEGDVDEIFARDEVEFGGTALGTCQHRQLAVSAGNRAENAPGKAFPYRFAFAGQLGFHGDIAGRACGRIGGGRGCEGVELRHFWRAAELFEVLEGILRQRSLC